MMDEKERPTEQEYERKAVAEGDMALAEDVPEPEPEQRPSGQLPGEDQGLPT